MIKLICIDQQHADIAGKQLVELERKTAVIGRIVIATGGYDNKVARVQLEAMACIGKLTTYEIEFLEGL